MSEIPLHDDSAREPYSGKVLLERALAMVAFAPIVQLGMEDNSLIADFQQRIRRDYPLFDAAVDNMINVRIEGDGAVKAAPETRRKWLFRDIEKNWTITLTQEGLSLLGNAAGYTSWSNFVERLGGLVRALQATAQPSHCVSLGVRYLNTGPTGGDDDPRLDCAKELTSITGNAHLNLSDLFWIFDAREGNLLLRSGVMPPHNSYDPNMFEPRDAASWYLDIDVINRDPMEFERQAIEDKLRQQASRAHAVFYWAMPGREDR